MSCYDPDTSLTWIPDVLFFKMINWKFLIWYKFLPEPKMCHHDWTIYILVAYHSIELCQILVTCVDTSHALWSRSYTHIYAHAKLLHWELSNIPFHFHVTTKINSPCFHVFSSPKKKIPSEKKKKGGKGMVMKNNKKNIKLCSLKHEHDIKTKREGI